MIRAYIVMPGGTTWNRTTDTRIFSPLLYLLSYGTSNFEDANLHKIFYFSKIIPKNQQLCGSYTVFLQLQS